MKKILISAFLSLIAVCAFAQTVKEISRYNFATAIENREPVDQITSFAVMEGSDASIFFFTEIMNMEGTTVHHIWYKNGEVAYDYKTAVNGPRWRTYSSMKAAHFKAGDEVKVEVTGEDNVVYVTSTLTIE